MKKKIMLHYCLNNILCTKTFMTILSLRKYYLCNYKLIKM